MTMIKNWRSTKRMINLSEREIDDDDKARDKLDTNETHKDEET